MKKIFFTLIIVLTALCGVLAQTEISGALDATPIPGVGDGGEGITGAPKVTWTLHQAIDACRNLVHDGKKDWYLPSSEEAVLFIGSSNVSAIPGCTGMNCTWGAVNGGNNFIWVRGHSLTNQQDSGAIIHIGPSYNWGNSWTPASNANGTVFCVR